MSRKTVTIHARGPLWKRVKAAGTVYFGQEQKKSKTVLYDGVAWRHQQLHGDIVEIDAKES